MSIESSEGYIKMAPFFKALTEKQLGVDVPEEVLSAWTNLSLTLRAADHLIDRARDVDLRKKIIDQGLSFLLGGVDEISGDEEYTSSMSALRSNLTGLPEGRRGNFFRNLRKLLSVTEEIKTTSSPDNLALLTRLEGQITARLFLNLLPAEYEEIPNYQNCLKIATRLGRAGNAFDTFIDLPGDYRNGELSVAPTLRNRLVLLRESAPDSAFALVNIGPNMIRRIGDGIILTLKKRPSNQVTPNQ